MTDEPCVHCGQRRGPAAACPHCGQTASNRTNETRWPTARRYLAEIPPARDRRILVLGLALLGLAVLLVVVML